MIRKLLVLLMLAIPSLASSQPAFVTGNQYVWAEVVDSTGWIWFGAGPVENHTPGDTTHELSYNGGSYERSYLSVMINDSLYTNDADGQAAASPYLTDGKTSKIADTLQTIWRRTGFDVVQNVYPVEFGISGTIVLSIEIVNHRPSEIIAQAQYLLHEAVDGFESAAEAHSLVRYPRATMSGEVGECIVFPDSLIGSYPVPPFFISYTQVPGQKTFFGDLIGVGYLSDSAAPLPLGLINPSQLVIGDFTIGSGWGISGLGFPFNGQYPVLDQEKQIQWPPDTVSGTGKDSVAVIARMCYGTGDIDICSGQPPYPGAYPLTAITLYPHLLNTAGGKPTPNKFRVETLIFEDTGKESAATLSVTGGQSIVAPLPVSNGGASQTQAMNLATLHTYNDFYDLQWTDSVFANSNSSISMGLTIADSLSGNQWQSCSLPISMKLFEKTPAPNGKIISLSGSYDGSTCNARCTEVVAFDTGIIRIPVLSVVADSLANMSLSIAPNHAGADSTFYTVCVIDSMLNGYGLITLTDSAGNASSEQYSYCTIVDTLAPLVKQENKYDTATGPLFDILDNRPWDRGLDAIIVTNLENLRIDASNPTNLLAVHGVSSAWISLVPIVAGKPQSLCIEAIDLAGNKSDTCLSFEALSVSNTSVEPIELVVYPSPASDRSTIVLQNADGLTASVEVLDVLGRVVDRFQISGSYDWQTSGLPSGTYILQASIGGEILNKRIIKE